MLTKRSLTTAGKLAVLNGCMIYPLRMLRVNTWLARVSLASHTNFYGLMLCAVQKVLNSSIKQILTAYANIYLIVLIISD
jgi:hypothetical protein